MRFIRKLTNWQQHRSSVAAPLLFAAVSMGGVLMGCQSDRSDFGAEFIPEAERQAMLTETVSSLALSTKAGDSKNRIANFTDFAIGDIYDATYGQTQCALASEFFPSTMVFEKFKPEMEVNSIALRLNVRRHYGKGQLKLTLYAATPETYTESGKNLADLPHGKKLGEAVADKSTETIEFALPRELGTQLARSLVTNNYSLNALRNEFHGFYIAAQRVDASGQGQMLFFNTGDRRTGLSLSWQDEKAEKHSALLPIFPKGRRFNMVDNNLQGTAAEAMLGKSSEAQEASGLAYLIGDGGTSITVDFAPFLKTWKAKGLITVQRAQLLIAADKGNTPGADTVTYGLASFTYDGSSYAPVVDAALSSKIYNGLYDHKQRCYVLNITGYVQHLLNTRNYPSSLHILPASRYVGICRLTVGTSHNAEVPARLVITYSKI